MTTAADTILAIDLGRYKSVACVYPRSSREHNFRTFDTTPAELTKLLNRHPQILVVIEACANTGWAVPASSRRRTYHLCPVGVHSYLKASLDAGHILNQWSRRRELPAAAKKLR